MEQSSPRKLSSNPAEVRELMTRISGGAAPGPAAEPRSLVKYRHQQGFAAEGGQASSRLSQALMRKKEAREIKPDYHAQCQSQPRCVGRWEQSADTELGKLTRVISGHMGWVRAVAVDPGNQWFATGAGDRVIKVSFHKRTRLWTAS